MKDNILYVGLDVHRDSIAAAVAEREGEARSRGIIPNTTEAVAKLIKQLGPARRLRVCYEAGPCGYVLYRQLKRLGVHCEVIAPSLMPVRPGDRVKTDRRDALKLVRSYRAGELSAVCVPEVEREALRDLVRAREAGKSDQQRARQRLGKFLLRQGLHAPRGTRRWSKRYLEWIAQLQLEQVAQRLALADYLAEVEHAGARVARLDEALGQSLAQAPEPIKRLVAGLQALRGVAQLTALTIAAELGELGRFRGARQLMGYSALVAREYSSGKRVRRGTITKTGNAHLRRVLVEASWHYAAKPAVGPALKRRQAGLDANLVAIAWQAQQRLYRRYHRLVAAGKSNTKAIVAVARELTGFIWAIGVLVERGEITSRGLLNPGQAA